METSTEDKAADLKASRDANALLLNCIAAMNEAIVARDKYIEFLTASGRFTMADVHASDSLANDVVNKTSVAYGLVPIKEMIPPRYKHLFGTRLASEDRSPIAEPSPAQEPPEPRSAPDVPPQDVTSDAFTAAEVTLKFSYDNSASAAEFSKSSTAAILSWYNTYLTTVINQIRRDGMKKYTGEIGITNDLLIRDGFLDNFKQYTRQFANQMGVKVRLVFPDGTSSLIVPMSGLT